MRRNSSSSTVAELQGELRARGCTPQTVEVLHKCKQSTRLNATMKYHTLGSTCTIQRMHWAHISTPTPPAVCWPCTHRDCTNSTVPHTASAKPFAIKDTTANNNGKPTATA